MPHLTVNILKRALGLLVRTTLMRNIFTEDDFPVFMYHRVLSAADPDVFDDDIYVTGQALENNIKFLKKHFKIIPLNDFISCRDQNGRKCAITFDDGWVDNYDVAFPILARNNVPATVFIPSGMIGTNKWFWFETLAWLIRESVRRYGYVITHTQFLRLISARYISGVRTGKGLYDRVVKYCKTLSPEDINIFMKSIESQLGLIPKSERILLNWQEIEKMSRAGLSFGSHCVNHNILTNLNARDRFFEISASREELLSRRNSIDYADCISFPNGSYSQEILDWSKAVGYKLLFSASINTCPEGKSPVLVHRIGINRLISSDLNLFAYSMLKAKGNRRLYKLRKE